MTTTPFCPALPREKVPIDGAGPRGFPDCYYPAAVHDLPLPSSSHFQRLSQVIGPSGRGTYNTSFNASYRLKVSRTLDSTFRYARFVKKLRVYEEEQRKGRENKLKELKDQQISDFFIRCDRRSLINNVARRVDLCMRSYEEDLDKKRSRLKAMFAQEEEANTREVVVRAQAATETMWQEKMERLQYLLDKRRREHDEKYKDPPLSKCTHVRPCIVKLRQKEAQEMQLYQMQEKQAMKMQELEFDKMWVEVGMKESDALAARMEIDAIERYRRDLECKEHSDMILAQREKQREIDRVRLKQEQLELQAKYDADMRKEFEEEEVRRQKRLEIARERREILDERHAMVAKQKEADDKVEKTWASLQGQGMAEEQGKKDLIRRKKVDLDKCNAYLVQLKRQLENSDVDKEADKMSRAQQEVIDRKRCDYLLWSRNMNREGRKVMLQQIADRAKAREELEHKMRQEEEKHHQLQRQLDELCAKKALDEAKTRKYLQKDILQQIEYNKLLKERALQEEMEQRKKAEIAAREYQEELNRMLCRSFFSDEIHPFMKQMVNLKDKRVCPCSKPTWCKEPTPEANNDKP